MTFTPEQKAKASSPEARAKAAVTRAANKAIKDAKEAGGIVEPPPTRDSPTQLNRGTIPIDEVRTGIELPAPPPVRSPSTIIVNVDWLNIPMDEARLLYGKLKQQFENAGVILNARSMPADGSYACFVCECSCKPINPNRDWRTHQAGCTKVHIGQSRAKDYGYQDPKTGLMMVIECCGEAHWGVYQKMRIDERSARNFRTTSATPEESAKAALNV